MSHEQQTLALDDPGRGPTRSTGELPHGLQLLPEFVNRASADALLGAIEAQPWSAALSRRVQHYGWTYDYRSRRVAPDAYLGPLPGFLASLVSRLQGQFGFLPDQAIVNEYRPGEGIAPHTDCVPCFGERVAMVALGSDAQMDFRQPVTGAEGALLFPARALLILEGDARRFWTHGIAKRKSDPTFQHRRSRRVSITFRTVIVER